MEERCLVRVFLGAVVAAGDRDYASDHDCQINGGFVEVV